MRALTTTIAERPGFQIPPDGLQVWRDAAQIRVAERVIDACVFSRPGTRQLILAVTADDVVVLDHDSGAGYTAGEEIVRWKRATLTVTHRPRGYLLDVVIQPPAAAEKVECRVGRSPLAESFLALLCDPTSRAAATG